MAPDFEIQGSNLLNEQFGGWPSFHDSEIVSINFDRAKEERNPSIAVKVHVFEMTSEVNESGYYKLTNHCDIEFNFESVEDVALNGFNHQNVISEIYFSQKVDSNGVSKIHVEFEPCYGVELEFKCGKVMVTSVTPTEPKN
jgi:hypothetical protein